MPRTFLCKSHPDFHIPADVEVGRGFDGDAYVRRLKSCGVDAVVFFAKCHYGHAYYPTDIGTRHPGLTQDMLGAVVDGCKRHEIGAIAYYSVFLDSAAVRLHPDWRLQATSNKTDAGFDSGNFSPLCVNSPYADELLLPQCREIVTRYPVDELFFDTMTGFQPCFCPACREGFGRDIPTTDTDPVWLEYVRWYSDCFADFFDRVPREIHAVRPDVAVIFNWKWGYTQPSLPPREIDRLAADLICTGEVASAQCRYFAGIGLPFDYMTGRFASGLGDWNSNTPESLKYTAAVTVANGGGFYLIDRQLPDGSLEERAYDALRDTFTFIQQRRDVLVDSRHVPEIAVLDNFDTIMGPALEYFPSADLRVKRMAPFQGLARMFMEHAGHYTALPAERLCQCIDDYRLVIVPEQEYLDANTRRALIEFISRGGAVLYTQADNAGTIDLEMLALAGLDYHGQQSLPYSYIALDEPLLLPAHFAEVAPEDDVATLYAQRLPLNAGEGGKRFGHGYAPAGEHAASPAVTQRFVGAGSIIYVAAPLFAAYFQTNLPQLARLACDLLNRALPDPLVRVDTAAQVELVLMRQADDLLIHLVNHSGRERLSGYYYPITAYMPELRDIPLSIKLRAPGMQVRLAPEDTALVTREDAGYAHVVVPNLQFMTTLRVGGYFAAS